LQKFPSLFAFFPPSKTHFSTGGTKKTKQQKRCEKQRETVQFASILIDSSSGDSSKMEWMNYDGHLGLFFHGIISLGSDTHEKTAFFENREDIKDGKSKNPHGSVKGLFICL
jgi:hypothetical protein